MVTRVDWAFFVVQVDNVFIYCLVAGQRCSKKLPNSRMKKRVTQGHHFKDFTANRTCNNYACTCIWICMYMDMYVYVGVCVRAHVCVLHGFLCVYMCAHNVYYVFLCV